MAETCLLQVDFDHALIVGSTPKFAKLVWILPIELEKNRILLMLLRFYQSLTYFRSYLLPGLDEARKALGEWRPDASKLDATVQVQHECH